MLPPPDAALLWVSRLDQALLHDPLFPAWRQRALKAEAVRVAAVDGFAVDPLRLAGLLAGLPLRHVADYGAERHALEVLVGLRNMVEGPPGDRTLPALARLAAVADRRRSVMEAALTGMLAHVQDGGDRMAALMALPVHLARVGVTRAGPLPCLTAAGAFRARSDAPAPRPGPELVATGLADLAEQARAGLDMLMDLRRAWASWRRRIGPRRSNALLPALVDYATAQGALAPAQVAGHFGISLRGAGKLLAELVEAGVLVDAAGRETWKLYVTQDLAAVRQEVERVAPSRRRGTAGPAPKDAHPHEDVAAQAPRARPSPLPDVEPGLADDLSALLFETDQAVAKVRRRLAEPILPFTLDPE